MLCARIEEGRERSSTTCKGARQSGPLWIIKHYTIRNLCRRSKYMREYRREYRRGYNAMREYRREYSREYREGGVNEGVQNGVQKGERREVQELV